ncbi:hypothetical protein [Streptomyces griseosporeus]
MPAPTIPPKPKQAYPRPPIAVLAGDLFREPVYDDGQPYADDSEDDDEDAIITP